MLSTLKFKKLNFDDEIKPRPRGSPVLIYHNNHIYSFGGTAGTEMLYGGRYFQEMWELNLFSRRWINCELHTKSHADLR